MDAYVDGQPAPVYLTDHLLRSVPLPAGDHTVELRYEAWTLRVGMRSRWSRSRRDRVTFAAGIKRWRRTEKNSQQQTDSMRRLDDAFDQRSCDQ